MEESPGWVEMERRPRRPLGGPLAALRRGGSVGQTRNARIAMSLPGPLRGFDGQAADEDRQHESLEKAKKALLQKDLAK